MSFFFASAAGGVRRRRREQGDDERERADPSILEVRIRLVPAGAGEMTGLVSYTGTRCAARRCRRGRSVLGSPTLAATSTEDVRLGHRVPGRCESSSARFSRMRNAEIADALAELGTLYELDGAVRYRVIAYKEAARVIRQSPVSVAELAQQGKATDLPGIGDTLQTKIVALLDEGEIPAAAKLKEKFPATLVEVTRIPGVGAKTARRMFDELGITNLDELREAAIGERIRGVKGLGAKVEENVLAALEKLGEEGPAERVLLSEVLPVAEELAATLEAHPACDRVTIAGSARRMAETCKDIDLIATATEPEQLSKALAEHPLAAQAGTAGASGTRIVTHNGISVDLRIVPPAAYGNLLQHFTGSKAHNVELRERAVKAGLSVSEHGIKDVE